MKRGFLFLLAIAFLSAGKASADPHRLAVQQGPPIIYEVTSWGHLVFHLELAPDGKLQSWERALRSEKLENVRSEQRDPALYELIVDTMRPFEQPVAMDCRSAPTDGPTGIYKWSREGRQYKFEFYYGCSSSAVRSVEEVIWSKLRPIT
jgi:hypothetical protein